MREIKFRGISERTGEFVYGSLFFADTGLTIIENGGSDMTDFHFVKTETVGQFTGIKDNNSKEIYEGDNCRILYTDWASNTNPEISLEDYKKSISSIGSIEYFAPEFNIVMKDRYGDFSPMSMHYGTHGEIEVIGNIHETPELLK